MPSSARHTSDYLALPALTQQGPIVSHHDRSQPIMHDDPRYYKISAPAVHRTQNRTELSYTYPVLVTGRTIMTSSHERFE